MLVSAGPWRAVGLFDLNTCQTELFFTAHPLREDDNCVIGAVVLEGGKMITVA